MSKEISKAKDTKTKEISKQTNKKSSTKSSSRTKEISKSKGVTQKQNELLSEHKGFTDKEWDKLPVCPKCKLKSKTELIRIDTNYICGITHYHREHPQYICICRSCAKKLSDVVDKWLGKEYPIKWEINTEKDCD